MSACRPRRAADGVAPRRRAALDAARRDKPGGYVVCLSLLLVGLVAPAHASEESQAISARGLIELNAGHTQEALALFDKAVAADPSDPDVRYQRGVTRAKLRDYSGAIEDLRVTVAARPDFAPAALELGVALTETGKYQEAEPWLLRAQTQPDLDAQASFFLGLVQLRMDRMDAAQENFARARARDPSLDISAQYYEGVIAYRRHDLDVAEERFTAVERANADSAIGRESVQFLDLIRRSRRSTYSLYGTAAFEYDTNVTLAPTGVATTIPGGVTGQADGRFVMDVGGQYVPWTYGPMSLAVSYEFFQSLQFDLTNFNLQDHRPAAQLLFDFDRIVGGIVGRYDYYLLGGDSFLSEATAFPWLALREDGVGRTELYLRVQYRDYKNADPFDQPGPTGFDLLNGLYNFFGMRQIFDLGGPERQLWFGYQTGFTSPTGAGSEQFQYISNEVDVALRWLLPYAVTGQIGYRFEHQGYAPASSVFQPVGDNRQDNDHRAIVSFERPLSEISEHLFVNAAWFGTFNQSNKTDFEYDRQIGSIGAEVRF